VAEGGVDETWIRRRAIELEYDQDAFERAYRLAQLLREIGDDEWLATRLALKGGTCINFFHADLPRLSVDADFDYVGAAERDRMKEDRPDVEKRLTSLAEDLGYRVTLVNKPSYIMWRARFEYTNARGNRDNIKADVNFLMRVPLYGVERRDLPRTFELDTAHVPCLTVDDVYGGKLKALTVRAKPRDMYDAAHLFQGKVRHDEKRLRKAFLFYAHMDDAGLGRVNLDLARGLTQRDYENVLYPVLREEERPTSEELAALVLPRVETMLDLDEREQEFQTRLLAKEFVPELLFGDVGVTRDIAKHPAAERRRQYPRRTEKEGEED